MFRLNYSSVDDAFKLGSEQIKDVQEEIKKLKDIVLETNNSKPKEKKKDVPPEPNRIGKPDTVDATFEKKETVKNDQISLSEMIRSPQFEEIVKKYISEKYPDMNKAPLKSTNYEPSKSTFGIFKETFGELCSNVKNIVTFFIVSILIYIMFSIYIDR
jgi:hypothetical protein